MALPTMVVRAGRQIFRNAKGRFISKAKFELLRRISPVTGRFQSAEAATSQRAQEAWLRKTLGRPPAGQNWVRIASKYGERFGDLLSEMQSDLG